MRELAERFYTERTWPFQLARYLTIGGLAFVADFGSLALQLHLHWWLPAATTIAFALGTFTHFTLNKYVNFKAHDRPVHHQAANYAIVAGTNWLVTLGIVTLGAAAGINPLAGKLVAVAVNVPIGFLGHRYLSFGKGIAATLRQIGERRQ